MSEHDKVTISEITPRRSYWLPMLGAGLLVAGGATIYQESQTSELRRQLAASQQNSAELQARLSETDSQLRKALTSLEDDVARVRHEISASVAKAQVTATRRADFAASRIAKQQEEQTQQLTDELGKVKEFSLEASTKLDGRIDGLSSQVGSVKADMEAARADFQNTKLEMQRARGDMGMMSGLIATNSKQIQVLRELGERNILEFTVVKASGMRKVGDIQVKLRKTDARHNRYSLDVLADDKLVEKKDRTVNEPVQFYTAKARQPYELVVNQVEKDKIVGYLSTPKLTIARSQPPAEQ